MNKNNISEGIFIKALNIVGTDKLDKVFEVKEYCLQDILDDLRDPNETVYYKFMFELVNVVEQLQKEKMNQEIIKK